MMAIHNHFRFSKALLNNPARCRQIIFLDIPFFQLYEMRFFENVRRTIVALPGKGMPHKLQRVMRELMPNPHIANSYYRRDLEPISFCTHNRQGCFVRAYRLLQNNFFKVEATFHSDTLGKGKHYSFAKALRGATEFFRVLDQEATPISLLDKHSPDYFFVDHFEKEVGVFEKELLSLKEARILKVKEMLKESLKEKLKQFQKTSSEIAQEQIKLLQSKELLHSNLTPSL